MLKWLDKNDHIVAIFIISSMIALICIFGKN
jgi:hypothetical protein